MNQNRKDFPMDFGTIKDRDTAETGAFCHFWHPTPDDLKMDDGQPVGAMVRGMQSFTVRKAMATIRERGMTGQAAGVALIRALVIEFVRVERDGKPLTTSADDVAWLMDRSAVFEGQIMAAAEKLGNAGDTSDA